MKTIVAILCLCLGAVASAFSADSVGRIVSIEGKASATGADGTVRALEMKSDIFMNDKIVTPAQSKLQIRMADDSMISQGEKSEMTIDEFVYDPGAKKEGSCSLKLAKGLFRTITGKITELKPDRFKVRTNMATIGIRGCDLGFTLDAKKEDILVFGLPKGHSVLIEKTLEDGIKSVTAGDRILTVVSEGVAVSIQSGLALQERALAVGEAQQFMKQAGPSVGGGGSSSGGGTGEGAPSSSGAIGTGVDGGFSAASVLNAVNSVVSLGEQAQAANQVQAQAEAQTVTLTRNPPASPGVPVDITPPTEPPSTTTPPASGPPVLVGGHPELYDWEWGIWSDGTTTFNPNTYQGAAFLSPVEFQSIASGATMYDLSGSGMAGAVVQHGSSVKTITGFCMLDVHVGQSSTPRWGGSFSLNNMEGDTLDFSVNSASSPSGGAIDANGNLTLTALSSYNLYVNGVTFNQGSLTASSVNGNLIKPGVGSSPISAAAGRFNFQHGGSATVNGAFGASFGGGGPPP